MPPSPNTPIGLTAHLRQATRAQHHLLDHHPLLASLMGPGLTMAGYGFILSSLHGAQKSLEDTLEKAFALFPGRLSDSFELAPRLPQLEQDLADLERQGWPVPPPMPSPASLAGCDNLGSLLGLLYVQEGARLGSEVITRTLAKRLPQAPMTYFAQAKGAVRWPAYEALAQRLSEENEVEITRLACQAAQAVFTLYLNHMDACQKALENSAGPAVMPTGRPPCPAGLASETV